MGMHVLKEMSGVKTGGWAHNHKSTPARGATGCLWVSIYRAEQGHGVWTQDRRHMGRGAWQACRFLSHLYSVLAGE